MFVHLVNQKKIEFTELFFQLFFSEFEGSFKVANIRWRAIGFHVQRLYFERYSRPIRLSPTDCRLAGVMNLAAAVY